MQPGERFSSGFVVVEKSMYRPVRLQERDGFLQVRYRIEYDGVDRRRRAGFEREIGKKVHKPLEHHNRIAAVVEGGNIFGTAPTFEMPVA